jgi:hypothetical protein
VKTILITDASSAQTPRMMSDVPDEFAAVIAWLVKERTAYQPDKWDYSTHVARVREGLTEDSWMWLRGVENYAGRVRMCQEGSDPERDFMWFDNPIAIQAILKLAATIVQMPELLLAAGDISKLPAPGVPSGVV